MGGTPAEPTRQPTSAAGPTPELPFLTRGSPLGDTLLGFLAAHEEPTQGSWVSLLELAYQGGDKSRASQRWRSRMVELVSQVTQAELARQLVSWVDVDLKTLTAGEQSLLRGLVWAGGMVESEPLAQALADLTTRAFKKLRGVGATNQKIGNACLHALGTMPEGSGIPYLSQLNQKLKYANARRLIDNALDAAAEASGFTRTDLDELSVPSFGLDSRGRAEVVLGEHVARLAIDEGAATLTWQNAKGKLQKSVPKAVKESHPAELKALKLRHKELAATLEAQETRLEGLYQNPRVLPLVELQKRYLEHPVVGSLARRLVWRVQGDDPVHVLFHDGKWVDLSGVAMELNPESLVHLLHLLELEDEEELLVWRDRMELLGLRPPFPQLWRAVYGRDPKARRADRFAGHLVKQFVLSSVCRQRGWRYAVQGYFDGHNWPSKDVLGGRVTAQFEVDAISHAQDDALFTYLVTGPVHFHSQGLAVHPTEIPAVVYSEVLRDVDIMVSTATVTKDLRFDPTGIREVWSNYYDDNLWGALHEHAKQRRAVLERVLPRTILAAATRLEQNELVVTGAQDTFRIHLGTTHVRRAGEQEPMDVRPSRAALTETQLVFLPFEGDGMISDILAKAFHLVSFR